MSEKRLDDVIDRIIRIEEKVDKLLEFKWQIIGGSLVASVFITIMMQVAIKVIADRLVDERSSNHAIAVER